MVSLSQHRGASIIKTRNFDYTLATVVRVLGSKELITYEYWCTSVNPLNAKPVLLSFTSSEIGLTISAKPWIWPNAYNYALSLLTVLESTCITVLASSLAGF